MMCEQASVSHDRPGIPTLPDIRKKVIELNSIDLCNENQNQIFFDEISTIIDNLSAFYRETQEKDEGDIVEIVEEIFSIIFSLSENGQPQLFQLINPLFILKSVSKSALSQFCLFLNSLKKENPEIDFGEEIVGFLNSTKEILFKAIKRNQMQIEFIDLLSNSKLYLTHTDSIEILSTIIFLTDKYLDKKNLTFITSLLIAPFQKEKTVPPLFIEFLSHIIRHGLVKEIETVLIKQTIEMFDNETLMLLVENPSTNDDIFLDICKIAKRSKNQPLCNSIALKFIQDKKGRNTIQDKLIIQIISYCSIEQFSLEFWNEVGNLDININFHESIIERIINRFRDEVTQKPSGDEGDESITLQSVLSKLVFDPNTILSHEEAVNILRDSNDNISINCILTLNFNDDILSEPSFWYKYSHNYKREKNYKNAIQCFWFRYRNNQIRISDILFYLNNQPNENSCNFFQNVFDYFDATFLIECANFDQIIYENVKSPLFPSFWLLFKGLRMSQLYAKAPEETKIFFYYGLCCNSFYQTPMNSTIHFIQLEPESYELLFSIIKGDVPISFDTALPENIQPGLLYFISSTLMCLNLRNIQLINDLVFVNYHDYFLFLALLKFAIGKKSNIYTKFFDGISLYSCLDKVKPIIKDEESVRNINLFFSTILSNFSSYHINYFATILTRIVDILWNQFKNEGILSTFPRFDELMYQLYSFNLHKKDDYNYLGGKTQINGFFKLIDNEMMQMLFEYYMKSEKKELTYSYLPQYVDVSELLKDPKPELFSFLKNYIDIDYSKIKEDQFDENLILSSFVDHFKLVNTENMYILIESLNEYQVHQIIKEFVDSVSFDSIIQIILKEKSHDDQMKILSIEQYLHFIKKEVFKTINYVIEQGTNHELFSILNEYIQSHPEIDISLNPEDQNFFNINDLDKISESTLFDFDNILNSSFDSEEDRIYEAILFLIKNTIHKLCNQEEISEEIKANLFLPSYQTQDSDTKQFVLLPTFESFSNLKNIIRIIYEELVILNRKEEILPFLTTEDQTSNALICELDALPNDLKNQSFFIIKTCPLFKSKNFPISDILKMTLLDYKKKDTYNSFFNAINVKLCRGSTGILYYINFLHSCSSQLKITKKMLNSYINQCLLNTPESFSCFEKAIPKLFVTTEDEQLIYLDVDFSLLKKTSRQSINFIRDNLLKGPFTISYFSILSSLSLTYPNLIASVFDTDESVFDEYHNNHDIIWFIKKIIPFINGKESDYFNIPRKSRTDTIITLISNFINIPQLGDKIIQFFFENLLDFNFDIIIAFLFILRMECDCTSLQPIIVGYLIRYKFIELSQQLIEKINSVSDNLIAKYQINQNYSSEEQKFEVVSDQPNNEEEEDFTNEKEKDEETKEKGNNEEEEEDSDESGIKKNTGAYNGKNSNKSDPESIKKSITQSVTFLLLLIIRYEENEINDSYEIASMLSKKEDPIYSLTKDSYHFIQDWSLRSDDANQTLEFKSSMFIPFSMEDQQNKDTIISNIEMVKYDYRPPSDVSAEYFQELPANYANQLIIERIPRLNTKLTSEVFLLLLKYPAWVANWIIQRPPAILLQQHYDIISNCINEINELNPKPSVPSTFTSNTFSSSSLLIKNKQQENVVVKVECREPLNYENICDFIFRSDIYNSKENRNILFTLFLYISSHKPFQDINDETETIQNPKEILIFYAKKMLKETTFISNYCSLLFSFTPISDDIINDIIDLACSPMFRNNSDFLENILNFYKAKTFYVNGKIVDKETNRNQNSGFSLPAPNNPRPNNDFRLALNNNDIINIHYLLNHHPFIGMNNNNFNNGNNENGNENDEENKEEEDFSDIDQMYRYDFFVIVTMSDSPKVLSLAFLYAPQHLINASLKRGNCISNAFLRCLNSKDIQKYSNFFNQLKKYQNFYVDHEDKIITKIRKLLSNPDNNSSQIIALFSMLSYQTIEDPKKVCEEFYDTLSPFWQLVFDARDFISKTLLDENNLINTSFQFMKPVVHTLSFDFRIRYLRIFVRDLITTKTRSIVIRREYILEDSFKIIMNMTPHEFLGHISVNFNGERGIDAGGLLRDWFTNLAKALFNENYALFVSSKVHGTFLPNPNSYVNGNHLKYFEFTGRIFARAIVEQINLEPHLALALRKKLLKYDLTIDDIEEFDPDLFKSLKWILENDLSANPDFEMYFTADTDNIGKHEVYELIENGAKTLVTNENKQMFVQKTIEYRTEVAIQDQCCAFCTGFFSIIPFEKIGIFTPEELDRIICGESFIDVDDWQRNCHFSGQFSINHPTIVTFFKVIKQWDQKDIAKLLSFITGSPQVPLGGFAAFKELGRPITIGSVEGRDKLITAHTCSNMLDLPIYESEAEMNDKIRLAIHECNTFDFH